MFIIKHIDLNRYKISKNLYIFLESELVSGFMTEHAAVVFVFFFLAEYGSIVLMCILTSLLFLGGYLPIYSIFYFTAGLFDFISSVFFFVNWHSFLVIHFDSLLIADQIAYDLISNPILFFTQTFTTGPAHNFIESILTNPNLDGLLYGLTIGVKSSIMIFVFIWARASFPRIRFDQLMAFCWTVLLPILFASIIFVPCVLFSFDLFPVSINLI